MSGRECETSPIDAEDIGKIEGFSHKLVHIQLRAVSTLFRVHP